MSSHYTPSLSYCSLTPCWCGTFVPHLPLQGTPPGPRLCKPRPGLFNSRHMTARPRRHILAIDQSPGVWLGPLHPPGNCLIARWWPGAQLAPVWCNRSRPARAPGRLRAGLGTGLAHSRAGPCAQATAWPRRPRAMPGHRPGL